MNRTPRHRSPRGFTLVELLVVIGILLVLVALLLPMIVKAIRQGTRTRIAADLNAISIALAAYKNDFYDYPRITYFTNATTPALNGTGSGADLLGKALLGPGDVTAAVYNTNATYAQGQIVSYSNLEYAARQAVPVSTPPAAGSAYWQILTMPSADGANGFGWRVHAGGVGKIYPPYLQPDKFKTRGMSLLDYVGNPILYYAALPSPPNPATNNAGSFTSGNGNSYISVPMGTTAGQTPSGTPSPSFSMYNYSDNDTRAIASLDSNIPATFNGWQAPAAMLGNYSLTGYINPTAAVPETAAMTGPFILWSAGPDGVFGPIEASQNFSNFLTLTPQQIKTAVQKCDDVTNFPINQ